jgi:Trk K+ transport system NAD-binding subunit
MEFGKHPITDLIRATWRNYTGRKNGHLLLRFLAIFVSCVALYSVLFHLVAVDMLSLAGCSHVLHLGNMLGRSLARRIHGNDSMTRVIGQFDPLLIAAAAAARTPFVGTTLQQSRLRERVGLSVVGVWERGHFEMAGPDASIGPHTVLVLAGSQAQLQQFDAHFGSSDMTDAPVLILGGGRVDRATGRALEERGSDYRIVEQLHERVDTSGKYILGNAARADVLHNAGIRNTPAVVITPHDDALNIYLTLYCRGICGPMCRLSAGRRGSATCRPCTEPGLILSCLRRFLENILPL